MTPRRENPDLNRPVCRGDTIDGLFHLSPRIVDKLTPKGNIEPESLMGDGLDALKKIFG